MARLMIVLNRDEAQEIIPYQLVCETRYGARWETGKRRRLWKETFTAEERDACKRLFRTSHDWFLGRGIPEEVRMRVSTYKLWNKLAAFCCEV